MNKKYISSLLLAFTLASFLIPYFAFAASYIWKNSTQIVNAANNNEVYYLLNTGPATGLSVKPSNSETSVYVNQTMINNYKGGFPNITWLEVSNGNSLLAWESGAATGMVPRPVSISDPNGVRPAAKQSLGSNLKINGQVQIISRDGTNEPLNKELLVGTNGKGNGLILALKDENGAPVLMDDANQTKDIIFENGIYTWNQITVKDEMFANKKYTLYTNAPRQKTVNCMTGVPTETGNWLVDNSGVGDVVKGDVCTLSYSGRVDFMITEDRKIQTVGNANDWESEMTGRPFPSGGIPITARTNGINLAVSENLNSPMDKALSTVIKALGNTVSQGLNFVMGGINWMLNETEEIVLADGVRNAWTNLRNLGISLLVFALIIIAFANSLSINIEQYGLNRVIPRIIISIIMAYASWVIVLFFFDLAGAIQGQASSLMSGSNGLSLLGSTNITTPDSADILGKIGAILFLIIVIFGVLICGIVLFFLLIIRAVVLTFLLVVAPLAFIFNILPFTQNLYKQWWSNFFKWIFMAPVAIAIIGIGSLIMTSMAGGAASLNGAVLNDSVVTDPDGRNILFGIIAFAASLYMAATLPLSWGGKIMSNWSKIGNSARKGVMGSIYQRTGAKNAVGYVKDWRNQKLQNKAAVRGNTLAQVLTGGRAGIDSTAMKNSIQDAEAQNYLKQYKAAGLSQSHLRDVASNTSGAKAVAAWQALGEKDWIEESDLTKMYQDMGIERGDNLIWGNRKKHPTRYASIENARRAAHNPASGPYKPNDGFKTSALMSKMSDSDYVDIEKKAFSNSEVVGNLSLTDKRAESLKNEQIEVLTNGKGAVLSAGLDQSTASGNSYRQEIVNALNNNDTNSLKGHVAALRALAAHNDAALQYATDTDIARLIKAGKI